MQIDDASIVELLTEAQERLEQTRRDVAGNAEARDFSIAITSIEDAVMRTNVGFARMRGIYEVSDVQRIGARS